MNKQALQKAIAEGANTGANSAYALDAEATDMEAAVERFMDESLLEDFNTTPLHTMEDVLEERRKLEERRERIRSRSEQLLKEELATRKHEKEVQELQDAIKEREAEDAKAAASSGKAKLGGPASRGRGAGAAATAAAEGLKDGTPAPTGAVTKLTAAGCSKNLKPYVYDHTDFVAQGDANRNSSKLKNENEMLRKCLQGADARKPGAFEAYLRANAIV